MLSAMKRLILHSTDTPITEKTEFGVFSAENPESRQENEKTYKILQPGHNKKKKAGDMYAQFWRVCSDFSSFFHGSSGGAGN